MRKKILATLMVVGLLAAQTLTVCAAGSAAAGAQVSSGYTVAVDAKNGEEKNLTEMVKNSPDEVKKAVEGKKALTGVMDVKPDGAQKVDGKYVVTFTVQNLTSSMSEVTVLHFNGTAWEVVESSFNKDAKTVTAKFASLSPVVIVAKEASTGNGSGSGSSSGSSSSSSSSSSAAAASPKTGVASDWAMWIGAAVVLGAASVALKKKEA